MDTKLRVTRPSLKLQWSPISKAPVRVPDSVASQLSPSAAVGVPPKAAEEASCVQPTLVWI